MKKYIFSILFIFIGFIVFSQQKPTVAVATFDTIGNVTRNQAQTVTELLMAELVSRGTINVVDRVNFDKILAEMKFQTSDWSNNQKTAQLGRALNAGFVIRGQLMEMDGDIYMTSTMLDINTAQVLYSARLQVKKLSEIYDQLPYYCSQILDKIPEPNYFIGSWQTGGKIGSRSAWNSADISPYEASMSKMDDDKVRAVTMFADGRCKIETSDGESIEGTYSYDFNRPHFSLNAGSYSYDGKLFFNYNYTQFYVRYVNDNGFGVYRYFPYFKSFIKQGR